MEEVLESDLFRFIEDYIWSMAYVNGIWHVSTCDAYFNGKDLRHLLVQIKDNL